MAPTVETASADMKLPHHNYEFLPGNHVRQPKAGYGWPRICTVCMSPAETSYPVAGSPRELGAVTSVLGLAISPVSTLVAILGPKKTPIEVPMCPECHRREDRKATLIGFSAVVGVFGGILVYCIIGSPIFPVLGTMMVIASPILALIARAKLRRRPALCWTLSEHDHLTEIRIPSDEYVEALERALALEVEHQADPGMPVVELDDQQPPS